jgi:uncharacterized membrane protein YoaK (UPF0700 family)
MAQAATAKSGPHPIAISALLAFTAGYVDTVGFIALFGLFTAHVTGNFVLIGAALIDSHEGLVSKLLALPLFVLAVAATRVFILAREQRARDAIVPVLISQLAFLVLFLACGLWLAPFDHADAPAAILTGMSAVVAMAIQNAAARTLFASLAPTTVMTGNVTQIIVDLVDMAVSDECTEARGRVRKMLPPVATFAAGALAGALAYGWVGYAALTAPIMTTALVLTLNRRSWRHNLVPE